MNALELPASDEAIELYQQQRKQIKDQEASFDKREQNKSLAHARMSLVLDLAQDTALRAVNANGFNEALVWFWFNHFNVFWQKGLVGVALPDYLNAVIRPHSQGRFADLLLATLIHPAMLVYLDNTRNVAGKINENYARELLELHTLGVNGGYSQNDVKEVAKVLTGVGLKPLKAPKIKPQFAPLVRASGQFFFNPQKHEQGAKQVVGQVISGQGFAEIETLITLLSKHPATAQHICTQLAVFLLGDAPAEKVINEASQVFKRTEGDLGKVSAFLATQIPSQSGQTFKDPYRYVISAVRLLSAGVPLKQARPLVRWLKALGQPLFGRHTPDGYSLYGRDWQNAGQLTQRFQLAPEMVAVVPHLTTEKVSADRVFEQASTQQLLARLSANSQATLAQAHDAKERLALLLASPEFMVW